MTMTKQRWVEARKEAFCYLIKTAGWVLFIITCCYCIFFLLFLTFNKILPWMNCITGGVCK